MIFFAYSLPSFDDLRKITIPTLIIWGDRDQFFPIENAVELYRLIISPTLAVVPNADHSMSNKVELFTTLVNEFLSRNTTSSNFSIEDVI